MARRRLVPSNISFPDITVKGHKLAPSLDAMTGIFKVELDDGTVFESATLAELKTTLSKSLETATKKPPIEIPCLRVDYGNKLQAAKFVGYHKTNKWNPLMFIVDGTRRCDSDTNDYITADTDINKLNSLIEAKDAADAALEKFLKNNRFKPPKRTN